MDDYFILQDLKQMVENIVGEQSSNCLQSVIIYIASWATQWVKDNVPFTLH